MKMKNLSLIKQRIRILLTFTKSFIRTKLIKYPVLYNVNKRADENKRERVLLAYLVPPFLGKIKNSHHNEIRNLLISNALDKAGFIVDVIDVRAPRKPKIKEYKLAICEWTEPKVKIDAKLHIFFAAGKSHKYHNLSIIKRYEMLKTRKKIHKIKPVGLLPERMPYVEISEYIIGIGNKKTIDDSYKDYKNIKKIFRLNNHVYKNTKFIKRKFSDVKNNFLFISSFHPVRGGLDLLLEIFPKYKNLNLFILGYFLHDNDFCHIYQRELFETPNIHPIGFVNVLSREFYEISEKCGFVIVPTCSEGQSSSILQSCATGLIPITTKDSGIDVLEYNMGFEISDDINQIEKTILSVLEIPTKEIQDMSSNVYEKCVNNFSEEKFEENFQKIIEEIKNYI